MKKLQIKLIDPKSLIPYVNNSKLHSDEQVLRIASSIQEYGFDVPIVVDKNMVIIKGHGRVLASIKLNLKEVPVIVADHLDELQVKAARIADNKTSSTEYNNDLLKFDVKSLELKEFNLAALGIRPHELNELLKDIDLDLPKMDFIRVEESKQIEEIQEKAKVQESKNEKEDEVPEVKETKVKLGDIYQLGNHRLMCGDSTDEATVSKLMDGEKADMVFTDPPYGMFLDTNYDQMFIADKNHKKTGKRFKEVKGDHEDFSPKLIDTIFKNFSNSKEIFIWGADYFSEHIINRSFGSWIVWDKRCNENMDKVSGNTFELCWSKQKHKRLIARIMWSGHHGMQKDDSKTRIHPTQKPTKLIEWFFEQWGCETKTVVDIYGGSGSTLIACEKTNRKCFMMELDPHYIQVIIDRWEKYTGQKAKLLSQPKKEAKNESKKVVSNTKKKQKISKKR